MERCQSFVRSASLPHAPAANLCDDAIVSEGSANKRIVLARLRCHGEKTFPPTLYSKS